MKKIFFLAATAAIALSSCSKNEVSEIANPNENPNAIGLNVGSFASKATTDTDGLNTTDNKLTLYSSDEEFGGSGSLEFTKEATEWTTVGDVQWGTDISFPLSLYSMNDGTQVSGNQVVTDMSAATAKLASFDVADDVTVAANTTRTLPVQKDLVYYASRLADIPSDGNISAVYKHALSRIMMQYTADDAKIKLYIAKVRLVNAKDVAGAEIAIADDNKTSIDWSTSGDNVAYNYFAPETVTGLAVTAGTGVAFSSANDLFIIPQEVDYTDLETAGATSTYVEVIYCAEYVDGSDTTPIIGYKTADQHPDYASMDPTEVPANTPLYAKVAFPVCDLDLLEGTYYNFVLNFSGSDIYSTGDEFVDEDGEKVEGTDGVDKNIPEIDDPINTDPSTAIGLTVKVIAWPDADTDTDLGDEDPNAAV